MVKGLKYRDSAKLHKISQTSVSKIMKDFQTKNNYSSDLEKELDDEVSLLG